MNNVIKAYTRNSVLAPNQFDQRIGLYNRSLAMLDAAIMVGDYTRGVEIIDKLKDHIKVENDTTDEKIVVSLYRILDFIQLKLTIPNPNVDKLRDLVQTMQIP